MHFLYYVIVLIITTSCFSHRNLDQSSYGKNNVDKTSHAHLDNTNSIPPEESRDRILRRAAKELGTKTGIFCIREEDIMLVGEETSLISKYSFIKYLSEAFTLEGFKTIDEKALSSVLEMQQRQEDDMFNYKTIPEVGMISAPQYIIQGEVSGPMYTKNRKGHAKLKRINLKTGIVEKMFKFYFSFCPQQAHLLTIDYCWCGDKR